MRIYIMENKKIEWTKEVVQLANEIADVSKDIGIPGVGIVGKFAQDFYNRYLISRFNDFCKNAEIDEDLLLKIQSNENYSNCFYSVLETVRKTHSKIGLIVLALIYKDHWENSEIIIQTMRSFSEISDNAIIAFIELYESIPEGYPDFYMVLDKNNDPSHLDSNQLEKFDRQYQYAVELINRTIFLEAPILEVHSIKALRGLKIEYTDLYYQYCIEAKKYVK